LFEVGIGGGDILHRVVVAVTVEKVGAVDLGVIVLCGTIQSVKASQVLPGERFYVGHVSVAGHAFALRPRPWRQRHAMGLSHHGS
jgi:hypothetical protein